VLIAGGRTGGSQSYTDVSSAEIYDPHRNIHGYRFNDQAAVRASGGDL